MVNKATIEETAEDIEQEFVLETRVVRRRDDQLEHYDTHFLSEMATRRLVIDGLHALRDEGESPDDFVDRSFREKLRDVLDEIEAENKTATDCVRERYAVIERIEEEFNL